MYSPRTGLCALIFLAACGGGASPAAPMVDATSADAAAPPTCPEEPRTAATLASPADLDAIEKEESQLGALHTGSPEWTAKVKELRNRYARVRTKAMIDLTVSPSCQLTLLKQRAQAGEDRMATLVP